MPLENVQVLNVGLFWLWWWCFIYASETVKKNEINLHKSYIWNFWKVFPKFYFGKRSIVHCSSALVIFFIVFGSQALGSITMAGIVIVWMFKRRSVFIKLGSILAFPVYMNIHSSYGNARACPHVAGLPPPVTVVHLYGQSRLFY